MAAKHEHEFYVATQSGVTEIKGESYTYMKDVTRVRAGHPLLEAAPDYFKPVDDHIHHDVEAATAKPGEKRA